MLLSEAQVLSVLREHATPMTRRQLQQAGLSESAARASVDALTYRGLLIQTGAAFALSTLGERYVNTGSGQRALAVPKL